jgi:tryptophan-rich sensory protein
MIKKTILFLVLNFSALAIGGLFTGPGVSSSWYQELNQAPWTPPGWVFGFAWTLIMLCFSFYMAYLISSKENRKTIIAWFAIQWVLNIAWNPIFFYFHQVSLGLICISALTILVAYFLFKFRTALKLKTLLVAPYFIWLLIASSLNAYILFYN